VTADLRVLADARWVASAPLSSHARYLRALSAAWAELPNGPLLTLVGPGARPRDLVRSERIRWHRSPELPGRQWQRPGSRMWLNTFFTAISLAKRPDVLFFPWSVLPRLLVAPAVVTVHDVCFRSHPDRFDDAGRGGDAVLGAAVRSATEVVTPSAEARRGVVAAYGLSEQHVTTVRHGIAPAFRPTPAPGDAATLCSVGLRSPYFLCVSTHEPRKNLEVLARAYVSYVERGTAAGRVAQLVLVGRKSAYTTRILDVLAASAAAREHTMFVEGLSDVELAALYRHAAAAVLPTVCEGFGFPVLESIACGTPALVSDLPVFRELVGDAAVYVPVSDVAAWADALGRAVTDGHARDNARAASVWVTRQFGWRASACQTLRVLERAARTK